jgi:hypothetical protein
MSDPRWACQKCKGEGMHRTERGFKICDCPTGQSKLRYLKMTEDEKRKERRERRVER